MNILAGRVDRLIVGPAILAMLAVAAPPLLRAEVIEFTHYDVQARQVVLVGDFNGWDPTADPMDRSVNGVWSRRVDVPGGKHRYNFLVDGSSRVTDLGNPDVEKGKDGDLVSLIAARSAGSSVPVIITTVHPYESHYYDSYISNAVSIVGLFNGWDVKANPLTRGDDGLWTTTLHLPPGTHPYGLVFNGDLINDEFNSQKTTVKLGDLMQQESQRTALLPLLTGGHPMSDQAMEEMLQKPTEVSALDTRKGANLPREEIPRLRNLYPHLDLVMRLAEHPEQIRVNPHKAYLIDRDRGREALLAWLPKQAKRDEASLRALLDEGEKRERVRAGIVDRYQHEQAVAQGTETGGPADPPPPKHGEIPVHFRVHAPRLPAVTLSGSFLSKGANTVSMQKQPDGWHTCTVNLRPGVYTYSFRSGNGRSWADPDNPNVIVSRPGAARSGSQIIIGLSSSNLSNQAGWSSPVEVLAEPFPSSTGPRTTSTYTKRPRLAVRLPAGDGLHPLSQEIYRQALVVSLGDLCGWRMIDAGLQSDELKLNERVTDWEWHAGMHLATPYLEAVARDPQQRWIAPLRHPILAPPDRWLPEARQWIADSLGFDPRERLAGDAPHRDTPEAIRRQAPGADPLSLAVWLNRAIERERRTGLDPSVATEIAAAYADLAYASWITAPRHAPIYAARALFYASLLKEDRPGCELRAYVLTRIGRPGDAATYLQENPVTLYGVIAQAFVECRPDPLYSWIGRPLAPFPESPPSGWREVPDGVSLSDLDLARAVGAAGDLALFDERTVTAGYYQQWNLELNPFDAGTWIRAARTLPPDLRIETLSTALTALSHPGLWHASSNNAFLDSTAPSDPPDTLYDIARIVREHKPSEWDTRLTAVPEYARWELLRGGLTQVVLHMLKYAQQQYSPPDAQQLASMLLGPLQPIHPLLRSARDPFASMVEPTISPPWPPLAETGLKRWVEGFVARPGDSTASASWSANDSAWDCLFGLGGSIERLWPRCTPRAVALGMQDPSYTPDSSRLDNEARAADSFAYNVEQASHPARHPPEEDTRVLEMLDHAQALAPLEPEPYRARAKVHLDRGRGQDALDQCQSYLDQFGAALPPASITRLSGEALLSLGRFDEALPYFKQAAATGDAQSIQLLGAAAELAGETEWAVQAYHAVANSGSPSELFCYRIRAYRDRRTEVMTDWLLTARIPSGTLVRSRIQPAPPTILALCELLTGYSGNALGSSRSFTSAIPSMGELNDQHLLHALNAHFRAGRSVTDPPADARDTLLQLAQFQRFWQGDLSASDLDQWLANFQRPGLANYLFARCALERGDRALCAAYLRAGLSQNRITKDPVAYTLCWVASEDNGLDPRKLAAPP